MKKASLVVVLICGMLTVSAMAQGSSKSDIQNSDNSPHSTMQGCLVKSEHNYYLQPTNGGKRVELNGEHDFRADVGHEIKVQGSYAKRRRSGDAQNANNSATVSTNKTVEPTTSPSRSSGSSQSINSQMDHSRDSNSGGYFTATKVTTISDKCSTSGPEATTSPQ